MTSVEKTGMTSMQRWVLGLTSLASFMISLDSLVVSTALSTIKHDLKASLTTLEWTVNAYSLTFAVLLLTGSALGDRFGRKKMFMSGLVLFVLASVACALSPTIGALITARAIQGVGAAMTMPLALTQISAAFPPQQRGKVLGIFSGITGLAIFVGPLVGGAATQGQAWQWIFWINVPIGLIAVILVGAKLEESFGPNKIFDVPGVILITLGGLGLVWGLIRGNEAGWSSAEVLATLIAGVVLVIAFVFRENAAKAPMLPMRFFKIRAFSTANFSNFTLFASLYGTTFMLAQFFQNGQGYSPLGAGLRLMPWTATLMICAPIAGNLADKLGERLFMVLGLSLNFIGLGWISFIAKSDVSYVSMLPALLISGAGISMAMPAAQKSVVGAVKLQEIGQASGAINMLRFFGGVFGIAILGAVFAGSGSYATHMTFSNGFGPAMGVAAIIAIVGAVVGLGMSGKSPRPAGPPPGAPGATGGAPASAPAPANGVAAPAETRYRETGCAHYRYCNRAMWNVERSWAVRQDWVVADRRRSAPTRKGSGVHPAWVMDSPIANVSLTRLTPHRKRTVSEVSASHTEADKAAACSVVERITVAWEAHDADAFADTFTEDGSMILSGNRFFRGREEIRVQLRESFSGRTRAPSWSAVSSTSVSSGRTPASPLPVVASSLPASPRSTSSAHAGHVGRDPSER